MLLVGCTLALVAVTSSAKLECAVTPTGNVGHCSCSPLAEVRCFGLQSVPAIDVAMVTTQWNTGFIYRGIYLARQNIRSLPRSAFSSLPVSRIVLNFNHFGDDIDRNSFVDPDTQQVHQNLERGFPGNVTSQFTAHQPESNKTHTKRQLESSASLLGLTLTELYMGACKIKTLPVQLFRRLASLRKLHLWGNTIETLPASIFRYNTRMVELSLWGNRIDQLEPRAFEGLRSLRYLDLDRNNLKTVSASAVAHLTKLTRLSLNGNRIHAMSHDLFGAVNSLRSLSLDSNGLGFIYARTLDTLTNLITLSIRRNDLHILADELFANLTRLTDLLLDHNRIEHVWYRTFHGLRSLVRLSMESNQLSHVPDGAFGESTNLKHVCLSDNRLTSLGRCVVNGASLRRLELHANQIRCDCGVTWMIAMIQRGRVSGTCRYVTPEDNSTVHASMRIVAEAYSPSCRSSMTLGAC